ncbi:hypothetical protein [Oscillatoria acuminata]|uniref:Uncharacterized protein n=1 Tax=Oscillatoria acuminata PCC 6304 TaxID=56110 RepID=K9TS03_9CYAN|nr:hypothetical protein [Oscillatoria acuminata]AFY84764.1 hypothetical protein Oscil6304_5274 [Oscillatoria acuminata PCC 6304]
MLVIVMENQVLAPRQVCQSCLLADASGQPRWRGGQLSCGYVMTKCSEAQPDRYQCQMGFTIANID